jgi:two-component system invasion response regulator UvrY
MKILLIDDHAVVRQGYASLLSAMLDTCHILEASTGSEGFSLWQQHTPDLIILDIHLPDLTGLEIGRRILERDASTRILFFSMYDELPMVQQALDVGALGYMSKSGSPRVLLEAVTRVMQGKPYVEHELAMRLAMHRPIDERGLSDVTPREFEIFVMLAKGLPSKTIAEHLCVSVKTVANHTALLKSKLQVTSTAQFVHLAIQFGVIKLGEIQSGAPVSGE